MMKRAFQVQVRSKQLNDYDFIVVSESILHAMNKAQDEIIREHSGEPIRSLTLTDIGEVASDGR